MQEKVKNYFNQLIDRFKELEKGQKTRLIVTTVLLLIVLGTAIYFSTRPRMSVLISNLDFASAGEIQNALNDSGITNRTARNGTAIEVLEADASRAQIVLAEKNIPNKGVFTYEDALKFSGMGTTESVKKENFKMVKQSSLSENLGLFEGVESARVTLVIPDTTNYFIKSEEKSSATAVLKLSKPLDKSQASAIARYLARSVEGLTVDKVEIIDTEGNSLYSGLQQSLGGTSTSEYDLELVRKNELENKVRSALAPLYNDVKIVSNLVINWDKEQQRDKTFTPTVEDSPTGLIDKQVVEKQTITNSTQAQEPGVNNNNNTTPNYQMDNGTTGNATVNNTNTDYLQNEREVVTEKGVGSVVADQSSVSIYVYKYRPYYQKYMEDNNLLNGQRWEDFRDAQNATVIQVEQAIIDGLRTGTGIQNLTVVGYEVPVFYDYTPDPIKIEQIVMFVILALLIVLLAYGLIKKTQPDEITEIEPELSVEDLLVSTQIEEQKEAGSEEGLDIDFAKESEIKRQIEKFINEKPEAVAQLLRNWLSDDWE